MMEQSNEEFFHDFRQELLAGAETNGTFLLSEFMDVMSNELVETGVTEGFELCHYRATRGIRVDGYWFNDEGILDLFIADFESRSDLESLTRTDADAAFTRVGNFLEASVKRNLAAKLEITAPEYGLAEEIANRSSGIRRVNLILFSERSLSQRIREIPDTTIAEFPVTHQVWDISRLNRQRSSRSHKEALNLDFEDMFGRCVPCLPANLSTGGYQSYLMAIPADVLSDLYDRYGARLLEQNVRTFLQARGKVNKGIRATILNEPEMFFAYNNGITATAQEVELRDTDRGPAVKRILDLQVVNGGQTTASLFHTRRRDNADLSEIFVQMKLSVIDNDAAESVVPRISEYANTQNKVNAADFFSNHPFHIRMEESSRRIWAPTRDGAQRETRWFYERARGQYADAQASLLTPAQKKRFKAEHPKAQMFTKTDLAKFENVWDEHPRWVNLGAQKNFAQYAKRIGKEWDKSPDSFNEHYFKRAVARAIIFRRTERIVSAQPWYEGGYRANIVAYTLAVLAEVTRRRKESVDFLGIWNAQDIDSEFEGAIALAASEVNKDITSPPSGVSNISEWAKKEACWTRIENRMEEIAKSLPRLFLEQLISLKEQGATEREAKKTQKVDNGIEAQRIVVGIPTQHWGLIHDTLGKRQLLTPKEEGVLRIAMQLPAKLPSEKQSVVLLGVLEKARLEGIDTPAP